MAIRAPDGANNVQYRDFCAHIPQKDMNRSRWYIVYVREGDIKQAHICRQQFFLSDLQSSNDFIYVKIFCKIRSHQQQSLDLMNDSWLPSSIEASVHQNTLNARLDTFPPLLKF